MFDLEDIKKIKHEILKWLGFLLTTLELCSAHMVIDFLHFSIDVVLSILSHEFGMRDFLHGNIGWPFSRDCLELLSPLDLNEVIIQLDFDLFWFVNSFL
mgnify:CR=1 FL=1